MKYTGYENAIFNACVISQMNTLLLNLKGFQLNCKINENCLNKMFNLIIN